MNEEDVMQFNQQAEYDAMAQQSMTALQNQEMMEQEAYESGDISGMYGSYTDMQATYGVNQNMPSNVLPDVDPTVTEQQATVTDNSKYANVFAKVFGTLASVFGEESEIGSKLKEIADNLDDTYSQDAYDIQQESLDRLEEQSENQYETAGPITTVPGQDDYIPTQQEYQSRQAALEESNENMAKTASTAVENDEFVSMADANDNDFTHMQSNMRVMSLRLGEDAMSKLSTIDVGAKEKSEVANNYMTMMRGIKTYNDTALQGIESKYQDDPEKLEAAKQGLGNMITRATESAYNTIGNANKQYDFLSKDDKAELDSMQLQGVDKTFSEYVKEYQMEPQASDDMEMYANASGMESDVKGVEQSSPSASNTITVESRVLSQKSNTPSDLSSRAEKVQMAETSFGAVLQAADAMKQGALDKSGLEL